MTPANEVATMDVGAGVRMASWSFYLGLLAFILTIATPLAGVFPSLVPFFLFGGLALAVLAIVLGVVGLFSINRVSALAGVLLGILTIVAFVLYLRYFAPGGIQALYPPPTNGTGPVPGGQ